MAWYDDPRLDDEGNYDYYVEELPNDYAKWELSRYRWKCDDCGKERHLAFETKHYFYCWDGWDYLGHRSCWLCMLKLMLQTFKWKLGKAIYDNYQSRLIKLAWKCHKNCKSYSFWYWYKTAKRIVKR
jgi:hypothetical protein